MNFWRAFWGHAHLALWVALFFFLFKFTARRFQATAWIAEEI